MNLIDSSFWFEFYSGTDYANIISEKLQKMSEVIVPTIIIVEVFKKILTVADETKALKFTAQMKKGIIAELDFDLSINSAFYGKLFKLPLADSIIYATAQKYDAMIFTLDKHFKDLPNVSYFEKK